MRIKLSGRRPTPRELNGGPDPDPDQRAAQTRPIAESPFLAINHERHDRRSESSRQMSDSRVPLKQPTCLADLSFRSHCQHATGTEEGHRIPDGFLIPLSVVPSKSLGCFYTGTCWISRNHIRRTMELGENDMTDTLARLEGARSPHARGYGQSPALCETD